MGGVRLVDAADAPEMNVPTNNFLRRGVSVVKSLERRVESGDCCGRRLVAVDSDDRTQAERVRKKKHYSNPKNPKGTALVVPGIRSLRLRRTDFGSRLTHVESLAGVFTFG